MPSSQTILVKQQDRDRIMALLRRLDGEGAELLYDEIDGATVVPDHQVPTDVVTMNASVRFVDLDTTAESTIRLVFPHEAGNAGDAVSILAPVGAALIGLRVGETIEWPLPNGSQRRLKVVALE